MEAMLLMLQLCYLKAVGLSVWSRKGCKPGGKVQAFGGSQMLLAAYVLPPA